MIRYLLVLLPPIALGVGAALGGMAVFLPALVLFGLVPFFDQVLTEDHTNEPGPAWLRHLPYLFVPVHVAALGYAMWRVSEGEASSGLGTAEQLALTLNAGLATPAAINVAHELMHRPGRTEQALAALLMATATYTHFCVEHVQGHHKNVSTPRDPATARKGESLYAFLPRTIIGGLRSAWAIEVGRSGTGIGNRLIRYALAQVVLLVGIGALLGPVGVVGFLAQSIVAVLVLETINYLEHYGLQRAEIAPGRYERTRPQHSWNSSHRASNAVLLNLARHSDHHAYAARSFRELRHYDDVPQLPTGYATMLLLATVPPLWFRVMDPRVNAASAQAGAAPKKDMNVAVHAQESTDQTLQT